MTAGVYEIKNTVTGSRYVGSAVNLAARWAAHRHSLTQRKKSPPKLQRAWDKYGAGAFSFAAILHCGAKDLLYYEQRAIDTLKPRYNTRLRAESNLGVRWSAETNAKKHPHCAKHTVHGVTGTINELRAHFATIGKSTAHWRVAHGWSVADAVTTPATSREARGKISGDARAARDVQSGDRPRPFRGETLPLRKLVAKYSGHSYATVQMRLQRGWDLEDALLRPLRVWP